MQIACKKVHPTITNKIEKLKKKLAQTLNNKSTTEEDKMLESLVIKTEILELECTLFESNRVYAKAGCDLTEQKSLVTPSIACTTRSQQIVNQYLIPLEWQRQQRCTTNTYKPKTGTQ